MTLQRAAKIFCLVSIWGFSFTGLQGQESTDPQTTTDTLQLTGQQLRELQTAISQDSTDGPPEIPNVFTPNGDQRNDFFEPHTDGVAVYEFSVYTRSGTMVYHSVSPRIFWDGKSLSGHDQKEGIYYYVISETNTGDPFEKAGIIYLYR